MRIYLIVHDTFSTLELCTNFMASTRGRRKEINAVENIVDVAVAAIAATVATAAIIVIVVTTIDVVVAMCKRNQKTLSKLISIVLSKCQ